MEAASQSYLASSPYRATTLSWEILCMHSLLLMERALEKHCEVSQQTVHSLNDAYVQLPYRLYAFDKHCTPL